MLAVALVALPVLCGCSTRASRHAMTGKAELQHADDQADVHVDAGTVRIDITSASGIGRLQWQPPQHMSVSSLQLRLRYAPNRAYPLPEGLILTQNGIDHRIEDAAAYRAGNGWLEVRIPANAWRIDGGPITLQWIDYYR